MLTLYNNYHYGTANQTVNYVVNGSSSDWMYGEQALKNKIFAFTPGERVTIFGPRNSILMAL